MSKIVKFEGKTYSVPDDATMDEIDALISGSANPNAGILAAQAAKYPASPTGQPVEAHVPTMFDQAKTLLRRGVAEPLMSLGQAAGPVLGAQLSGGRVGSMATGGQEASLTQLPGAIVEGVTRGPIGMGKGIMNADPQQFAEGAADTLTGTLPAIYGGIRSAPKVGSMFSKAKSSMAPKIAAPFKRTPGTPAVPVDAPMVNRWMGVSENEVKFAGDPGKRLMDMDLLKPTKTETAASVKSELKKTGSVLDAKLKGASTVEVDGQTPVYDAAARAKGSLKGASEEAFDNRVTAVVDKLESRFPEMRKMTPEQAHKMKVEIGKDIDWRGDAFNNPINKMLVDIYQQLNRVIKDSIPGVEATQRLWQELNIADSSLSRAIRKDIVGKGSGTAAPALVPEGPTGPSLFRRATKKYGPWVIGSGIGAKVLKDITD